MNLDVRELDLKPIHGTSSKGACERPVILDPFAWSEDGSLHPEVGLVLAGAGRRFPQFHTGGQKVRTWQALCRGRNGADAKRNAKYLDPERAHGWTWDGSGIEVYDVIEWGWCHYRTRRIDSERSWGIVIEVSDDRIVLWEALSLARAVKASWKAKFACQMNERLITERREIWDLGPASEIDDDDMASLGMLPCG